MQGLGAAIVSPAALSIVTTTFTEGAERNKALGVWGAVAGSGGAAGVLLGGMLTEWAGLGVGAVRQRADRHRAPRCSRRAARREPRRRAHVVRRRRRGAVTAGLSLLVYALVDANNAGWGSRQTLGLLASRVALLAAFVAIEPRTKQPLVPFWIFRIAHVAGANVVGLLVGASLFAMFFFISLYLQQVLGYDALKAGFAYLPLALAIICRPASPRSS